jgi:hypothetical protein
VKSVSGMDSMAPSPSPLLPLRSGRCFDAALLPRPGRDSTIPLSPAMVHGGNTGSTLESLLGGSSHGS